MFVQNVNFASGYPKTTALNFNGGKPKSPKIIEEKLQQTVKKAEELVNNEVLQPAPKPKKHWWEFFSSDDDGSTSEECIDEMIRD